MRESKPSEKAIAAAQDVIIPPYWEDDGSSAREILAAAHDPALGLERSIRLGDVLDLLRAPKEFAVDADADLAAADLIEREFLGKEA